MSDTPTPSETIQVVIPQASVEKKRQSPSLIWLIPLIALLIGSWLGVQALLQRGTNIDISFKTAEGIAVGTKIKYRNVDVGEVKNITLSEKQDYVIVKTHISAQAKKMLVKDTLFWVVRPRISGGNVTGLSTVLAGSHIGMEAGQSQETERNFTGLEQPPILNRDLPGKQFTLLSPDIGSLEIGSPVYFRHIQAGQVAAYELSADGKQVKISIFINTPYDKFVHTSSRFWHANGIDVKLDSSGVKINTESLVSILLGGLAFENLDDDDQTPAPENTAFNTFANHDQALKVPDTEITHGVMVFKESIRGLSPGAQIDFRGIVIGEVISNSVDYDPDSRRINMAVAVDLYPERMRSKFRNSKTANLVTSKQMFTQLVNNGLRAQLRTNNLLTGQLYIALDFFPNAVKVKFDPNKMPVDIPTTPGSLGELQVTLASIANKLDKVPFDDIGKDLHQTLANANKLITTLDGQIAPEALATMSDLRATMGDARKAIETAQHSLSSIESSVGADSNLQQDTRQTLLEVSRAAQATRTLADYLERHPEALIRGKQEDKQ